MRKSRGERTEKKKERKRERERERERKREAERRWQTEEEKRERRKPSREKCLSGMTIARRSCSCRCSRQEDGSKREERRDFSGLLAGSFSPPRAVTCRAAQRAMRLAEM